MHYCHPSNYRFLSHCCCCCCRGEGSQGRKRRKSLPRPSWNGSWTWFLRMTASLPRLPVTLLPPMSSGNCSWKKRKRMILCPLTTLPPPLRLPCQPLRSQACASSCCWCFLSPNPTRIPIPTAGISLQLEASLTKARTTRRRLPGRGRAGEGALKGEEWSHGSSIGSYTALVSVLVSYLAPTFSLPHTLATLHLCAQGSGLVVLSCLRIQKDLCSPRALMHSTEAPAGHPATAPVVAHSTERSLFRANRRRNSCS